MVRFQAALQASTLAALSGLALTLAAAVPVAVAEGDPNCGPVFMTVDCERPCAHPFKPYAMYPCGNEGGPGGLGRREPVHCFSRVTVPVGAPAAVVIICPPAMCAWVQVPAFPAPPPFTITVSCTVARACDAHWVRTEAALLISIPGDTVDAEVFCDGVGVTGGAHAINPMPLADQSPAAQKPAVGDYKCEMIFGVLPAPIAYDAKADCFDTLPPPPP